MEIEQRNPEVGGRWQKHVSVPTPAVPYPRRWRVTCAVHAVQAISMWHHFTQHPADNPAPTLPGERSGGATQALLYLTLASCLPLAWLRLRTHLLGDDLESLLLRIAAATFSAPAAVAACGYLYVILNAAAAVGRNALVLDNSFAIVAVGAALVEAIVWRVAVAE